MRQYSRSIEAREMAEWRAGYDKLWALPALDIARQKNKTCANCGELLVPKKAEFEAVGKTRRVLQWPDLCPGCGQVWSDVLKPVDNPITRMDRLEAVGLPAAMQSKTFAAYRPRPDLPGAADWKAQVEVYRDGLLASSLGDTNWLVMHGSPGLGKTHLAVALLLDLYDRGRRQVRFHVWPEFTDRVRATYDRDAEATEQAVKREAMAPWLVVLDDVDKTNMSDWARQTLFLVLNHRLNEGLPTVLTFNHGPAEADPSAPGRLALEPLLGHWNLDRVLEVCQTVEFKGESFRSGVAWDGGWADKFEF